MEWYTWLIAGGSLAVLAGLVFLFYKYGRGISSGVTFVGGLAETVAGMLPDDASKLDAHDVVMVVGHLAKKMPEWANDPTNKSWLDCKEEILAFIEEQRTLVPPLAKLPKEVLEKVAEALFALAKALPESLK